MNSIHSNNKKLEVLFENVEDFVSQNSEIQESVESKFRFFDQKS